MIKDTANSFSSWFNSPYYDVLHSDTDQTEAYAFLETITNYLNLPEQGTILNIGTGKGDYTIHFNKLGYDVTEVDLSEKNIKEAKKHKNESLGFNLHNLEKPYKHKFDAVFNLFSDFGYVDSDEAVLNTIKSMKANLNETGFGVMDVMNTDVALEHLIPEETKTVEQIDFNLKRSVENGHIIKDIQFKADGKTHHFQERFKAFSLKDFEALFEQADTYLLDVFGDYKLNKFRPQTSERLVMIFK